MHFGKLERWRKIPELNTGERPMIAGTQRAMPDFFLKKQCYLAGSCPPFKTEIHWMPSLKNSLAEYPSRVIETELEGRWIARKCGTWDSNWSGSAAAGISNYVMRKLSCGRNVVYMYFCSKINHSSNY